MENICIHVPLKLKRRGGRKLVLLPEQSTMVPVPVAHFDQALMNGIAKAHRWQALYERGRFASIEDFAAKNKLNKSYAARVMRLNLLAPDIRRSIMEGQQPRDLKLADIMKPFSPVWEEQRKYFGFHPIILNP